MADSSVSSPKPRLGVQLELPFPVGTMEVGGLTEGGTSVTLDRSVSVSVLERERENAI